MELWEAANFIDCIGKKFGDLTVLSYHSHDRYGPRWRCRCGCGKEYIAYAYRLRCGETKTCGCSRRGPRGRGDHSRKRGLLKDSLAAKHSAYANYKQGAVNRSTTFTLTFEEFLKLAALPCYYCGGPPSNTYRGQDSSGDFTYQGIDREDNEKGYTRSNSVPCCFICNLAKGKRSYWEFLAWIKKVYEYSIKNDKNGM